MEPDSLGSSDQGEGSSGSVRSGGHARFGRFEALVLSDAPLLIAKDKVVSIEVSEHRDRVHHGHLLRQQKQLQCHNAIRGLWLIFSDEAAVSCYGIMCPGCIAAVHGLVQQDAGRGSCARGCRTNFGLVALPVPVHPGHTSRRWLGQGYGQRPCTYVLNNGAAMTPPTPPQSGQLMFHCRPFSCPTHMLPMACL